jgi:hypothetical protein
MLSSDHRERVEARTGGAVPTHPPQTPAPLNLGGEFAPAVDLVKDAPAWARRSDNKISGIITAADLSVQFKQLSEPFLMIGEIENHLRRIIDGKFDKKEMLAARDPNDAARNVETVSNLNFGELIRIIENDENWKRLSIKLDRKEFCRYLDLIRSIRNEVMHFDPDPIDINDLSILRGFSNLLGTLKEIGAT